ncbi:oxygen-independent coproporphyrinogen III oxidase [Aridibaculum aurantiacum]|uniref:oxygen-independent coproporphyrinogen III oxidase n=1 Tax=Aridibaculum aurantiacum TaxID=2810307 RepID=UPI001A9614BE|nr:oxygen-independent coproporphyrinogen III oxidase [Aridibaculum aurantiacum]
MNIDVSLLQKYNQPVPRYTSYPTVPHWDAGIDVPNWKELVRQQFQIKNSNEGISLYIHLPFCESLCTYCGCNKKITTNHSVEDVYLQAVLDEWKLYLELMPAKPVVKELHLGGGTPTFFSPANLDKLVSTILNDCIIHPAREFSVEGHPNNTTKEHLETLYNLNFRRISYGVQDNDPTVQKVINRIQPFENLVQATTLARATGFNSVNFDLIYGLPFQTLESIQRTVEQCVTLQPDRIAFYSYAHVPWNSRGQRLFSEKDLPPADLKLQLYLRGKELFTNNGYHDIGMDHFALPHDDLYLASVEGKLHRNFMGYTTQAGGLLIGLGVSSISDIGIAYAQNEKSLKEYYLAIDDKALAVHRGYVLTEEDRAFKSYILNIICRGTTTFAEEHLPLLREYAFPELALLREDGLVEFDELGLQLTSKGKNFVRNICKAFDLHLARYKHEGSSPMFSKAI